MRAWHALTLGLLLLVVASHAGASKCLPPDFDAQLSRADVVFLGEARSMDSRLATTFDVERVYKGSVPSRVVVHTNAVKYAMLPPPWHYLVYAILQRDEAGELALFVESCGGSQRVESAGDDLARLGEGEPAGLPGSKLSGGNPEPRPASPLSASEDAGEDVEASAPISADAGEARDSSIDEPRFDTPRSGAAVKEGQPRRPSAVPSDSGCAACELGRSAQPGPGAHASLLTVALVLAGLGSARRVRMSRPPRRKREPRPDGRMEPRSRSPAGRSPTRTRPF